MSARYCLPENYVSRASVPHFLDVHEDQYQNEVYRYARELFDGHGMKSVLDVGCGSGFKLMKYFSDAYTTGMEVEPTLSMVKEKYPDRRWLNADTLVLRHDLLICSDVIEHLEDPDALLQLIWRIKPSLIVISTPARELIPGADQSGPPRNIHHTMEWSREEFRRYIGEAFAIDHQRTIPEEYGQLIVCRP